MATWLWRRVEYPLAICTLTIGRTKKTLETLLGDDGAGFLGTRMGRGWSRKKTIRSLIFTQIQDIAGKCCDDFRGFGNRNLQLQLTDKGLANEPFKTSRTKNRNLLVRGENLIREFFTTAPSLTKAPRGAFVSVDQTPCK